MFASVILTPDTRPLAGELEAPGDRRLTHLALMLGVLTDGPTLLQGALESHETVATRRVLAQLGASFSTDPEGWLNIDCREGKLQAPAVELDCGSSAETLRLLMGLLAGCKFSATLTGDSSLLAQPVGELAQRLSAVGLEVKYLAAAGRPPLKIRGKPLHPLHVQLSHEHAELHDALLLAAMSSVGESCISCAASQPDHAQRLLKQLGAKLSGGAQQTTLAGEQRLHGKRLKLPGDISAVLPAMLCAALRPGSDLLCTHVGANPRRLGLIKTLTRSGAQIERERDWQYGSEPMCSLRVRGLKPGKLLAFNIPPNLALTLLDDYPLAVLAASQAQGVSQLRGAGALKQHAPDLQLLTAQILRAFGVDVELEVDGFTVHGGTRLRGAEVQCAGDLRLSRLAVAAALLAEGPSILHGIDQQALSWLPQLGVSVAVLPAVRAELVQKET